MRSGVASIKSKRRLVSGDVELTLRFTCPEFGGEFLDARRNTGVNNAQAVLEAVRSSSVANHN